MKIKIFNEDCFLTMQKIKNQNKKVDIILTSPPYNTGRITKTKRSIDNYENRYDLHIDRIDNYEEWTIKLFNEYDKILQKNGVILYNISYGNEFPNEMWLAICGILKNTNFMIADTIIWKKKSALPNNVSHNKLTRITEFVFVICRKNEYKTFNCNKKVKSQSQTGQNYYENIFNFIEAPNNDGVCKLNKATFSSELVEYLLKIYAKKGNVIYDSFIGTGTTALACKKMNFICIGSEISAEQCKFANERLHKLSNE